MTRFFNDSLAELTPYVPGEQLNDKNYIKLNTNESPFDPSGKAIEKAAKAAEKLELYPDPECKELREAIAKRYGITKEEVIVANGSDEILNFAFTAYCNPFNDAVFPDITYGFYKVFAQLHNVEYTEIPLKDDFSIDVTDYECRNAAIFIANPNAPTGIFMPLYKIEHILKTNPDNIVVVDEAYIDFGGESAVSLIGKYDNLLVVQTFSKSRSMAGARLGFGIANKEIIKDLETIRYSTNPYNVNSMTMAAGIGALSDEAYTVQNCKKIKENRDYLCRELKKMGFVYPQSSANFVFAMHPRIHGKDLYTELRNRGILVRHFNSERIEDYVRITVGSREQTETLVSTLQAVVQYFYHKIEETSVI